MDTVTEKICLVQAEEVRSGWQTAAMPHGATAPGKQGKWRSSGAVPVATLAETIALVHKERHFEVPPAGTIQIVHDGRHYLLTAYMHARSQSCLMLGSSVLLFFYSSVLFFYSFALLRSCSFAPSSVQLSPVQLALNLFRTTTTQWINRGTGSLKLFPHT